MLIVKYLAVWKDESFLFLCLLVWNGHSVSEAFNISTWNLMLPNALIFAFAASFQRPLEHFGFHNSCHLLDHISAENVDMGYVCISDQQPSSCYSRLSLRPQHHVPHTQGVWPCHGDHSTDWYHPNSFVSDHWRHCYDILAVRGSHFGILYSNNKSVYGRKVVHFPGKL